MMLSILKQISAGLNIVVTSRLASTVSIIGSGLMGSGIAAASIIAGHTVHLLDISNDQLKKSEGLIFQSVKRLSIGKPDGTAAEAMSKLQLSVSINVPVDSHLVIEAIIEDMKTKQTLFRILDKSAPPHCIFASNTSSLPIKDLAESVSRKDKFGGLHFFNPASVMKLVEIIKTDDTSIKTLCTLSDFAKSLGKTVVHCKDTPGFIVNRLLVPSLLEAVEMLERGDVSIEDIDTAMRLGAGHPMGPFELADYIGLDTLQLILEGWAQRYPGERAFRLNTTIKELNACGRLGKKSGRGFYKYDKKGKIQHD